MSARDFPMRRARDWKRARAVSLRGAIDLCLAYALAKHRRGMERIAALMGEKPFTLYKWQEEERMPLNKIVPFEHACGCHYLTEFLGHSAHKLVVDMPSGRAAREMDVAELQAGFNEAMALLILHWQGQATAEDTIAAITQTMGGLAWQRENVAKAMAPELALFGDEE